MAKAKIPWHPGISTQRTIAFEEAATWPVSALEIDALQSAQPRGKTLFHVEFVQDAAPSARASSGAMQLESLATHLWHATHAFKANGLPLTTRMTVVRLPGEQLLVHSPIPMPPGSALLEQLQALGTVAFIVAPNKMHHLFLAPCTQTFPNARVYGPKGLAQKRPDLAARLHDLPSGDVPEWLPDLEHLAFEGIPAGNESVWFHRPSATLIVTDLLQWMAGDLPWSTRAYATLTGVRRQLAVPLTVRALVRDRRAAARSAERVLRWPFERVVMAHNQVVDTEAYAQVARAFAML